MKKLSVFLVGLILSACGVDPKTITVIKYVDPAPVTSATEKVTDSTKVTDPTDTTDDAEENTVLPVPFDGAWAGKIEQRFVPTSTTNGNGVAGPVDDFCGTTGVYDTQVRSAVGTLTITGTSGTFTGILVDTGMRIIRSNGSYYCEPHSSSQTVTQAVNLVIYNTYADITCDPANCGTGLGDWRIGATGTQSEIVGRLTDSQTHIVDDINQIFDVFDFWKK